MRGNNRQDAFFVDDDRWVSLELLAEAAVGGTRFRYMQTINRFGKRNGPLWQSRFGSCALGRDSLVLAIGSVDKRR